MKQSYFERTKKLRLKTALVACLLLLPILITDRITHSLFAQNNPAQNLEATLQTLRTEHTRIVAKFNALRFDCKSNMRIRVDEAIADANKWKHTVDVLGLLEEISVTDLSTTEKEMIVRDRFSRQGLTGEALEARVRAFNLNDLTSITPDESRSVLISRLRQRGRSEQEIAEILSGGEAIKRELRPMYDNLDRLIWNSLRTAYEKAYQCCLCSAQDYLPPMMAALFREMTLLSEDEALQIGSIAKNEECARAVRDRITGAAGWRGTLTFTSRYQYKGSAERANVLNYWDESSTYEATLRLDGKVNEQGVPIATLNATAHQLNIRGGRGAGACYRISQQRQEVEGSTQDDNATLRVSQDPRTGTYNIYYTLAVVKARGTYKVTSKVAGTCNNPFNKNLDQTTPEENGSVDSGPLIDIEAQPDPENPNSLVGTKTVSKTMPRGGEMVTTVTWNLLYCKK